LRPRAIEVMPRPATYSVKIRSTIGAVYLIRFELAEPFALGRLAGIPVRAGVGESVTVGRTPAEESAFQLGLCPHEDVA
jgi:hypothetical protein